MSSDTPVPVTLLTGALGSGKTTLLNRILSEHHGKRIAVIENEYGEVGVDHELVIGAEEEIFEMNNGCICCTVRGDLIRILGNLMKRRECFDYILVESTGLADPGPVAQTFFMDDEVSEQLRLDAIVTLVDAYHIEAQLEQPLKAHEQIAFADVILLNKTDLIDAAQTDRIEQRVRAMNGQARIVRTQQAVLPLAEVLGVGGFDLARALQVDPAFLEPEYPFEWGGVYRLPAGDHVLRMSAGPDPTMKLALLRLDDDTSAAFDVAVDAALRRFSDLVPLIEPGDPIRVGQLHRAEIGDGARFPLRVDLAGDYVLFTEHLPEEFSMALLHQAKTLSPTQQRAFKPDHEHDDSITSVGVSQAGDLDPERIDAWLSQLLREKGQDLFRCKGVLSLRGDPRRHVFQGVHMLMDASADREWGDEPRHNTLIFIGRNLDRSALLRELAACMA
jgi:G3E family GTPase